MTTTKVLTGDCRAVMRAMPERSVHMVVTSPPYWALRAYKTEPQHWADGWVGELGMEPTPQQYVAHMVEVFREIRRVLRDDGTVWLNLGDTWSSGTRLTQARQTIKGTAPKLNAKDRKRRGNDGESVVLRVPGAPIYHTGADKGGKHRLAKWAANQPIPNAGEGKNAYSDGTVMRAPVMAQMPGKNIFGIPWRVAFALQEDGWILRQDIIWHKPAPLPESVTDRCTKSHEYIFLLTKRQDYYFDAVAIEEPSSDPKASAKRYEYSFWTKGKHQTGGYSANGHDKHTAGMKAFGGTRNCRDVWAFNTVASAEKHFAMFPPELPTRCILAGTSAYGCCPKCGAPWVRVVEKVRSGFDGSKYGERAHAPVKEAYAERRSRTNAEQRTRASGGVLSGGTQKSSLGRPSEFYGKSRKADETPRNDGDRWNSDNGRGFSKSHASAVGYQLNTPRPEGVHSPSGSTLGSSRGALTGKNATRGWQPSCTCKGNGPVPCVVLDPFGGAGTVGFVANQLGRDCILIDLNPEYAKLGKRRVSDRMGLLGNVELADVQG